VDQQSSIDEVQAPITTAPPQVRRIIELVLEVEKDKLYQKYPRSINEDIIKIIKEAVR